MLIADNQYANGKELRRTAEKVRGVKRQKGRRVESRNKVLKAFQQWGSLTWRLSATCDPIHVASGFSTACMLNIYFIFIDGA
jgi:hypothetical protein